MVSAVRAPSCSRGRCALAGALFLALVSSCGETAEDGSGRDDAGPESGGASGAGGSGGAAGAVDAGSDAPIDCVGSTDCTVLADCSFDLTLEECQACQGAACDPGSMCGRQFPCKDGMIVIRGCDEDSQCADLSPFCGMYIAVNNVCVPSDDI